MQTIVRLYHGHSAYKAASKKRYFLGCTAKNCAYLCFSEFMLIPRPAMSTISATNVSAGGHGNPVLVIIKETVPCTVAHNIKPISTGSRLGISPAAVQR